MPRLHYVKKARKDNPVVKRGEPYYWWQFAFGKKQYSKEKPRRSQLTQSSFLSQLYDLQDTVGKRFTDFDDLETAKDDLVSELEELRNECEDSLNNMPEHLQETSESGMLLRERIELLECASGNIESLEVPDIEDAEDVEDIKEWKNEKVEEYRSMVEDILNEIG